MLIRVSYGTAITMGLIKAKMLARPTTAYLMIHHENRCINNCAFCPQARESRADLKKLSRITWPTFELRDVVKKLKEGKFARICLQTVDYEGLEEDVLALLGALYTLEIPISLSITPVDKRYLKKFKALGVDYIGVGIDAASERIYPEIKESLYSWGEMWRFAEETLEVFGRGNAFIHLIAGLGETDREFLDTVERAYKIGAEVSLFAFTPIRGTRLEKYKPPSLKRYRKLQIGHYLIKSGIKRVEDFEFDENENLVGFGMKQEDLEKILKESAFMTHGCPGCNRPYYNEKPSKEPYNFPTKPEKEYVGKSIMMLQ
ncbi:biotin synthase [Palaeococcus pacificus DY20341]|uniref:Biotin synthase n=1 Tax=Palaeococcus pacificus DY20341 TaxID=1343739 RepID=A0A075LUM3_9EURY|nr:radical SAM protein [Palaeococcus pacificus]AIF70074.1 biotin synthase [Palaeococcus pacificus DY20341]